ncbi:MAG TPA: GerMN domain-containing protein [Thermoanaerobaculaceae bacterium]|nr:GerMN domain-containing protein [Thermoanaerobaculaceae bacterium]HRS14650.1 GerMN domain-containing protein [Thermoanaerobaculaceae bacterium]
MSWVVLGLAMAALGCGRRAAAPAAVATPVAARPGTSTLVLFFVGEQGRLRRESREVAELPAATQARVRLVLDELLGGSRSGLASPMPWAVTVQAVFADRAGNVFVDLSAPPQPSVAGTSAELAFVYSIVNSVVANCPGVAGVQLLIGGKEVATVGNIDLRRPLAPNLDVVEP